MGGGGGSSGPTLQQKQLQTEQAQTNAELNLQENEQRKTILNAMQGTRVFRGSALSRAMRGNNNNAPTTAPGPSTAQINSYGQLVGTPRTSLLDTRAGKSAVGAGAAPSGSSRLGSGSGSYRGTITP